MVDILRDMAWAIAWIIALSLVVCSLFRTTRNKFSEIRESLKQVQWPTLESLRVAFQHAGRKLTHRVVNMSLRMSLALFAMLSYPFFIKTKGLIGQLYAILLVITLVWLLISAIRLSLSSQSRFDIVISVIQLLLGVSYLELLFASVISPHVKFWTVIFFVALSLIALINLLYRLTFTPLPPWMIAVFGLVIYLMAETSVALYFGLYDSGGNAHSIQDIIVNGALAIWQLNQKSNLILVTEYLTGQVINVIVVGFFVSHFSNVLSRTRSRINRKE
jgi:hypothetical protein